MGEADACINERKYSMPLESGGWAPYHKQVLQAERYRERQAVQAQTWAEVQTWPMVPFRVPASRTCPAISGVYVAVVGRAVVVYVGVTQNLQRRWISHRVGRLICQYPDGRIYYREMSTDFSYRTAEAEEGRLIAALQPWWERLSRHPRCQRIELIQAWVRMAVYLEADHTER
jgi:hypothetical protein